MAELVRRFLFFIIFTVGCMGFCAGCTWFAPEETELSVYDPEVLQQIELPSQVALQVLPFVNSSPGYKKIMLRTGKQMVTADEFHQWAQTPAQLLTHYLRSVFLSHADLSAGPIKNWVLTGDILTFEGNIMTQEAVLSVRCTLTCGEDVIDMPVTLKEPFPEKEGLSDWEKTAEAMQKAMQNLAGQIAGRLNSK